MWRGLIVRKGAVLRRVLSAAVVMVLSSAGCSSGGGGDGGGDGRTDRTAVRVVHGALDQTPIRLKLGEEILQDTSFAQATEYVPVDAGVHTFTVYRANSPAELLYAVPVDLKDNTEYTLFLTGSALRDTDRLTLRTDVVSRPEEGFALVQVYNSYEEGGRLSISVGGELLGPVPFAGTSGYVEVASGIQEFIVSEFNERGTLGRKTVVIADRGELTLLVSGSDDLGVVFTTSYLDLD